MLIVHLWRWDLAAARWGGRQAPAVVVRSRWPGTRDSIISSPDVQITEIPCTSYPP